MKVQPSLRTGSNRSGLTTAPEDLQYGMVDVPPDLAEPTSRGTREGIARVRIRYARDGYPHATMPPLPRSQRALLPLFDLLGARLAYERNGSRLYDALISKLDAYGTFSGGPDRHDLEQLRDEEIAHSRMLEHMTNDLGGDPTAVTPSANVQLIASRGLTDVLTDPRTSLLSRARHDHRRRAH